MSWTREQRNVTIAAYLGWTLDAFDFFLMVFVLKDIAAEFNTKIPEVALGDFVGWIDCFEMEGSVIFSDAVLGISTGVSRCSSGNFCDLPNSRVNKSNFGTSTTGVFGFRYILAMISMVEDQHP